MVEDLDKKMDALQSSSTETQNMIRIAIDSLSQRPKELGCPLGPGNHVWIDDGLREPFLLPASLCDTPNVCQTPSCTVEFGSNKNRGSRRLFILYLRALSYLD